MIRRLIRRLVPADPRPMLSALDLLDGLPRRTPGAALDDAVARYALAGSPLYPDDELYIAPSGALIHVHHLTDEEVF